MTTYSTNSAHTFPSQNAYASHPVNSQFSDGTAMGCAKYWKAQGKSLREIADKLLENGHRPKRGGQGYAQRVKHLLIA